MRISDCSSDVCASDLKTHVRESGTVRRVTAAILVDGKMVTDPAGNATYEPRSPRSEARRGGKAGVGRCRSRWSPDQSQKQNSGEGVDRNSRSDRATKMCK